MGNSVENIHTNVRVKRVTYKAKAKSNRAQTEILQLFSSLRVFCTVVFLFGNFMISLIQIDGSSEILFVRSST